MSLKDYRLQSLRDKHELTNEELEEEIEKVKEKVAKKKGKNGK